MIYSLISKLPFMSRDEPKKVIKNVCYKGGGVKGFAFVGVAKALEEAGILPTGIIGSSAGAIFAAAFACRIPHAAMKAILDTTDFTKFMDANWGALGEGYNLLEYMGVYRGDYFYNWCGDLLAAHVGDCDITFTQVYERFGTTLVITATDLTKGRLVYFQKDTHSNMPIRHAIRCSMSIPVFFIPVQVRESDGLVHTYVDGGCTNNFPLGYFAECKDEANATEGDTIGFYLSESDDDTCPNKYHDETHKITNVIDLVSALVNTDIEEIQHLRLADSDLERIVNIPTFGISATDFGVCKEDIHRLQESGYNSTCEYLVKMKYV